MRSQHVATADITAGRLTPPDPVCLHLSKRPWDPNTPEFLRSLFVSPHTQTHTCTWRPQPLSSLVWRREGAAVTYTYMCSLVQGWWGPNLIQDVRLSPYSPYLTALRCTAAAAAAAAQRPQCGCDTCQVDREKNWERETVGGWGERKEGKAGD